MAINTLTGVANRLLRQAQIIPREQVGAIGACMINSGSEMAAKGATVRSVSVPEATVNTTYSPSMTIPEGDAQAFTTKDFTIDQYVNVQIPWDGEEQLEVDMGPGFESENEKQIQMAIRKIANTIEAYTMNVLTSGASFSVGTGGTTPFASDFDLLSDAVFNLEERGVPDIMNVSAVNSNQAINNLRKLDALWQVNTSGREDLLRRGVIGDLYNMELRQTAQAPAFTASGVTGATVNSAAYAAGATSITLTTAGSGTFLAGDTITISGQTDYKYVVKTGAAATGGTIVLQEPGLLAPLASTTTQSIVVEASSNRDGVILHRNAAELVSRPLLVPKGGDLAMERVPVRDPVSGLVFNLALFPGYYKTMLDISVLYDVKVWENRFVGRILG